MMRLNVERMQPPVNSHYLTTIQDEKSREIFKISVAESLREEVKKTAYACTVQVKYASEDRAGDVEEEDLYAPDPRDVGRCRVLELVGGVVGLEDAEREDLAC